MPVSVQNEDEVVRLDREEIVRLVRAKLEAAGLPADQAAQVADHLAYADSVGVHSHGTVRVEYYAERIGKGGTTLDPKITVKETGPCSLVIDGDNGTGFVVAGYGMDRAVELAGEKGVAVVGMRRLGHCGTLSYYLRRAAERGMLAISMCQSDPMVVPFGGAEPFFGTNPLGFGCPVPGGGEPIVFDMATSVQAWGKILDARARGRSIPDTWAVDASGLPTGDPFAVSGLSPVAGVKGYGLMMMVDIFAGTLLGAPFGPHVSSMYDRLDRGRDLGQLHIVLNPAFFGDPDLFLNQIGRMIGELHGVKPAAGFGGVLVPGENSREVREDYRKNGIPVVKEIYDYLVSDKLYLKSYQTGDPFASGRSQKEEKQ